MVNVSFKKGRKLCIFCGQTASKKGEHFWPAWASDYLPSSKMRVRSKVKDGELEKFIHQPGSPKTIQIRAVCSTCNSTWMSQIEERTKPILKSILVDQRPITISLQGQIELATWVALKLIVADRSYPEDAIFSDQECKNFANDKLPPDGLSISIYWHTGPFGAVNQYNRNHYKLLSKTDTKVLHHCTNFTFVFGEAFFRGWVERGPLGRKVRHVGLCNVPIWPPSIEPVYWPPVECVTVDEALRIQFELNEIKPLLEKKLRTAPDKI